MSARSNAEPECSKCGKPAATIELLGPGHPGGLRGGFTMVVSFDGKYATLVEDEQVAARIASALERGDWRALFAIDAEFAPFYCPTCNAIYCPREWNEERVWDEQDRGFLDATYGTCPNGHRRMLFD